MERKTRLKVWSILKPHKNNKDPKFGVYSSPVRRTHYRVWMKYKGDEHAQCEGFWIFGGYSKNPFEHVCFKHFEYGWIYLYDEYTAYNANIVSKEFQEFLDFMTNQGIIWL